MLENGISLQIQHSKEHLLELNVKILQTTLLENQIKRIGRYNRVYITKRHNQRIVARLYHGHDYKQAPYVSQTDF